MTDVISSQTNRESVLHVSSSALIAGAVAEVDPAQIDLSRWLTPAQRFAQMLSMIELVENIAACRLRKRRPELDEIESLRIVRTQHVRF